jgi:hypothetical protein
LDIGGVLQHQLDEILQMQIQLAVADVLFESSHGADAHFGGWRVQTLVHAVHER